MSSENPHKSRREAELSDDSGQMLLTRRRFLYGAAGAGIAVAAGVGAYAISSARPREDETETVAKVDEDVAALEAPESSLITLNDFEVLEEAESRVELVGSYDLKYGTLIWVNDDNVAACLIPTDKGSPLAQIGIMNLGSGDVTKVRSKAVGSKEHFEIYDVRATSSGIIWTEANVLGGTWRIYACTLNGGNAGNAQLLEEGDSATYDTPTLAAAGDRAFWQVLPKAPNTDGLKSRLMGVTFGSDKGACLFESARRMGTPPYSTGNSIVISPRIDRASVYYQLTNIDAESGKVLDRLTLPQSIAPLEAGYGATGFMFSLPAIYDAASAISNLGTYTPRQKPEDGNYNNAKWFGFARTPTAAPAWCDDLLIVKSSYSVCGVDLAAGNYFAIDVDDGTDTYGDYLATTGTHPTFVTFSNIDHSPVNDKSIYACRVKVWRPHELRLTPKEGEGEGEGEGAESTEGENATSDEQAVQA